MVKIQTNPYVHSGPVTGEGFFDREEEMRRLLSLLGTTPPTSVALYGPERIGKSSLLRQLCEVVGPEELSNRRLSYLDMQRIFSVEAFVQHFLQASGDEASKAYRGLEEAILSADQPVVLCLDEFSKVLANPNFNADFYDFLRSMTQTGRLALVIATLRSLKDLTVPSGADVFRFFNIFRPFPLESFGDEAARQLVEKPARRVGQPFSSEEVDWVLQNVTERNHPYHLQLLSSALFEARWQERSRAEALQTYQEALGVVTGVASRAAAKGAPSPLGQRLETWASVTLGLSAFSALLLMVTQYPLLIGLMLLSLVVGVVQLVASRWRR
jgi:hypothetical protein